MTRGWWWPTGWPPRCCATRPAKVGWPPFCGHWQAIWSGSSGPAADGDAALAEVLCLARDLPATPANPGQGVLDRWAPVIDAAAAAAGGDPKAAEALAPLLAELDTTDWAALAGVLRRILQGERGGQLLDGLDPADTAIVTVLLGRLGGQPDAPNGP